MCLQRRGNAILHGGNCFGHFFDSRHGIYPPVYIMRVTVALRIFIYTTCGHHAYCSDIKPDNLLFDARGHIKLTDLGTYGLHDHGNARVLCMYCNESSMEDLESVRTLRRSEYENARLRFQHSEEIEK